MPDASDMELLRDYRQNISETSFAELVQRHIALVYSVALRHVGIAAQAEEITQAVFIILARKAAGLRKNTILEGWLYETTRLTALSFLRGERRRQFREQEAYMQSPLQESADNSIWQQLAPLLDDALTCLGKKDRDAVVLRFFKEKSVRETATALHISEAAAQRRVLRALEKLRKFFAKRGVSSTSAMIAGTISANSVHAAPAGLAETVSAVAIAKGAAASASTLTLIQGALKIMAWTKANTAIVAGVIVVVAAGTATMAVHKYKVNQAEIAEWRVPRVTQQIIDAAAPQVTILPTKYKLPVYGAVTDGEGKWVGINMPMHDLIRVAYDWPPGRVFFPDGEPKGRYDFATTLPKGADEALQEKIKKTFGYIAQPQTRDMDALVLRVENPDASGLKPHIPGTPVYGFYASPNASISSVGLPISMPPPRPYWGLTRFLEMYLQTPVVDETGLTGRYDIEFHWQERKAADPNHDAMKQALLNQIGLELVPTNLPVEVLVLEKAK